VIRTVLIVVVVLLAAPVLAKGSSAKADRKSARRDWHQLERDWHRLELDLPDIPFLPGLPDLDLSGIEIDLPELLAGRIRAAKSNRTRTATTTSRCTS